MASPDPNVPDDIKKSLRRDWRYPGAPASGIVGWHYPGAGENADWRYPAQPEASPAPAAPAAPSPEDPSTAEAGLRYRELPAGVSRSSVPGIYVARGKNGELSFSNVAGADGHPAFASGVQEGGVPVPQRVRDGSEMAGHTYAPNSLRIDASKLIARAGNDPKMLQQAMDNLRAAAASNPGNDQADDYALQQLQGAQYDVAQRRAEAQPAGALGGLTAAQVLAHNDRVANMGLRARIAGAADKRAQAQEARQRSQFLMDRFQKAEAAQPGSGASLIAQTLPQGMTQKEAADYFTHDPTGQALSAMLLHSMQQGARNSLWPLELGDKAHLGQNVNWGNMKLDKNGNFAGFYDNSSRPTNEYPRRSAFGADNYDETLLKTISPAYWKALQQVGLHRAQPAPR